MIEHAVLLFRSICESVYGKNTKGQRDKGSKMGAGDSFPAHL